MPSQKLEKLLLNAKKSSTRLWPLSLIRQYETELNEILRQKPEYKHEQVVTKLQNELRTQWNKTLFDILPLEYPDSTVADLSPHSRPPPPPPPSPSPDSAVMSQRPQIPAPTPYKETDSWSVWVKNLESYFKLMKYTDEADKKELLLYLLGADRRKRLEDAISPAKTEEESSTFVTLKESCTKLWGTVDVRTAFAELFVVAQGAEAVAEYAAKFKALCTKAELTDERVIFSKFVSGLRARNIQESILTDKTITSFNAALERAKLLETIYRTEPVDRVGERYDHQYKNQQGGGGFRGQQGAQRGGGHNKQQQQQNTNRDSKQPKKLAKNQCRYCEKFGHWEHQCRKFKRDQANDTTNDVQEDIGNLDIKKQ